MNRLFCKESRGSIKGLLGMAALLLCSVACLALCFSQEKSIRESIDNNKIVNVVKSTYGRSFELKYMERNDTKKRLYICFHEDNGGVTPKMLNETRLALNNYLKENPDYFINQGYQTTIEFGLLLQFSTLPMEAAVLMVDTEGLTISGYGMNFLRNVLNLLYRI